MKLDVLERILLGDILATHKDNFATLKLVREARENLSFNETELKSLNFVMVGKSAQWNREAAIAIDEIDIEINETVIGIAQKVLLDFNDKSMLSEQHISLFEKIVGSI